MSTLVYQLQEHMSATVLICSWLYYMYALHMKDG